MKSWLLIAVCLVLAIGVFAASAGAAEPAAQTEAISPGDEMITLFNGRDLTGFYTWLVESKYEDPKKVFTVHDGMLHVSGDGYGYVTTKQPYKDYRLVSEFKWGPRTWGSRKDRTKDSGILVHCVGPDGSGGSWMAAIEAQIIQGGVGDLLVVPGKYADGSTIPMSLTCELRTDDKKQAYKDRTGVFWKKGGIRQTFNRGRINWYGRDPNWQDVLGFRGKEDVESPDGEWTRMEVICDGGHIQVMVNGVLVNEGFDAWPTSGQIIFQTEMAEIFFRKIELWPLAGKGPTPKS